MEALMMQRFSVGASASSVSGSAVVRRSNHLFDHGMQAFKQVLDELHRFLNVHLVVATREAGVVVNRVGPSALVVLQPLSATAAMDVLRSHLGRSHRWSEDGRDLAAAQQLVEVVEGNPLVLSVAGGLVQQGRDGLTLQVCCMVGACMWV
jgi:hypothetical protein